ncbi:MAG: hypothetical protein M0Z80_14255 [Treponema sp.]|nr:hypothetical protein [Treponema sp.]
MRRVRTLAASLNAKRHEEFRILCRKLGYCVDCDSEDRICNEWSILEKSFPRNRIHVIRTNRELGL